jgi:hypothetical protein
VLGQRTSSPITAVLQSAESLVNAAFAAVKLRPIVTPGLLVGRIEAPWGTSVAVAVPQTPRFVGWPGLPVSAQLNVRALPSVIATGTRIGVLKLDVAGKNQDAVVRASGPLPGPSAIWRLTRR